jgi:glycerol-3-phosphate cytidylyltransferase
MVGANQMIIYTGSTMDCPHQGHVDLLKWCRILAVDDGKVVVALNTDEFIKEFKGKSPIMTYSERKAVIEALRYVDEVIPNEGGVDSKISILKVRPDMIVVGSDWLRKDYCKQMSFTPEWLEQQHIALTYIPRHLPISTSEIKRRIHET